MARVYTPEGYAILGYYRLKSEALTALIEASGRPPAPKTSPTITLSELWSQWEPTKSDISKTGLQSYRNAFNHLQSIHSRPVRFLTVTDIEEAVRASDPSPSTRLTIQSLLLQMFRFAIAHDLADRNPAELIDIKKPVKQENKVDRRPFDPWEISELMKSSDPYFQLALIGCYTGMRPNELLSLCIAEVDLETQMLHIAGSKTKSGHFRHIPIHPAILSTITEKVAESAKFGNTRIFQNHLRHPLNYGAYWVRLKELDHTPHDTRHTFATYARSSGLDQLATKRILGHTTNDLTEAVYTHTDEAFLKKEMRKFVIM